MTDEKLPNADDAPVEKGSVETPEDNLEGSEPQVDQADSEPQADQADSEQSDQPAEEADLDKVVNESDESEDDAEAAMLAMLEDLPEEDSGTKPDDIDFGSNPDISNAQFQHLLLPFQ